MDKKTITIAAIREKIKSLTAEIDKFIFQLNSNNRLQILANAEKIVTLQKEYEQIKVLERACRVIEDDFEAIDYLNRLQSEIMDATAFKSSSLAENTIESYRFDGKREAYLYLKKLLK
jgi:hypothetical protein